jgi:hypothetical protein
VTLRDLTAADAALLQDLVDEHPFKPYRNHRFLSRPRQSAVLQAEIDRVRETPGSFAIVATRSGGDFATRIGAASATRSGAASAAPDAAVTGRPLAWDSAFFGVRMGRIEHVLRGPRADRLTVRRAIDEALRRFRAIGVQHIALKVDVADHDTIAVAEDTGFRLMDAIVTYIAHPRRRPPRPVKQVGSIRPFAPADTDQVIDVTREAYRGYQGRFQLDPHLPADKSDAFYLEWARNCCSGAMADRIFVAEDADGRLIGWASVKRAEPVSSVGGATVSVGSLGACRPESAGAYAGLICAAAVENHAAGVLTEAMTQSSNFAMVRVLEAVGAQYARAEYTFHAWLG